ncbi:MAG: hypothetical protein HGA19_14160 [Oscillochloris sp.]|nr:hypothetical protein [Oscillochloris sp.]
MIFTSTTPVASDSITLMAIVVMVGMVIAQEVSGSLRSERAKKLSQALHVALIPLIVSFFANAALRLFDALQ